ncbi:MAG: DUF3179 domain-containing protein [Chloroflexi bacterium]|nr:DUF3179 domain-containing protein [Chloroflexota bacterium]
MNRRTLLASVALTGAALLVACGDDDDDAAAQSTAAATSTPTASAAAAVTATAAASTFLDEQRAQMRRVLEAEFPKLDITQQAVDLASITHLLPHDRIPAIDDPQFDAIEAAADWLEPQEPVIAFERNGDARAYPLQILTHHEIVNDIVGEEPVIVTYCPLCNSAIAFSRVLDGEVREFGVSGKLRASDLIMYDRTNESLWQQLTGDALVGQDIGTRLEFLPAQIVSFAEFEAAFPDGQVLNRETGHSRNYGENPYVFYDRTTSTIVPVPEFGSDLDAKERVLTVEVNGAAAAFPFSALTEQVVIEAEIGGEPVVAFWQSGAVSALDELFIVGSRNVGSAGAFAPFLDGERLTFENREGAIVDLATGSTWNVLGQAVDGPMAGKRLEQILSGSHFWFAWSVFMPETVVIFESDAIAS